MACPHGEIDARVCVDCLLDPPVRVAPSVLAGTYAMKAHYHGACERNGCHIEPGDTIVYVPAMEGYCCASCAHVPERA